MLMHLLFFQHIRCVMLLNVGTSLPFPHREQEYQVQIKRSINDNPSIVTSPLTENPLLNSVLPSALTVNAESAFAYVVVFSHNVLNAVPKSKSSSPTRTATYFQISFALSSHVLASSTSSSLAPLSKSLTSSTLNC